MLKANTENLMILPAISFLFYINRIHFWEKLDVLRGSAGKDCDYDPAKALKHIVSFTHYQEVCLKFVSKEELKNTNLSRIKLNMRFLFLIFLGAYETFLPNFFSDVFFLPAMPLYTSNTFLSPKNNADSKLLSFHLTCDSILCFILP